MTPTGPSKPSDDGRSVCTEARRPRAFLSRGSARERGSDGSDTDCGRLSLRCSKTAQRQMLARHKDGSAALLCSMVMTSLIPATACGEKVQMSIGFTKEFSCTTASVSSRVQFHLDVQLALPGATRSSLLPPL